MSTAPVSVHGESAAKRRRTNAPVMLQTTHPVDTSDCEHETTTQAKTPVTNTHDQGIESQTSNAIITQSGIRAEATVPKDVVPKKRKRRRQTATRASCVSKPSTASQYNKWVSAGAAFFSAAMVFISMRTGSSVSVSCGSFDAEKSEDAELADLLGRLQHSVQQSVVNSAENDHQK